jgi:hypothetical protein
MRSLGGQERSAARISALVRGVTGLTRMTGKNGSRGFSRNYAVLAPRDGERPHRLGANLTVLAGEGVNRCRSAVVAEAAVPRPAGTKCSGNAGCANYRPNRALLTLRLPLISTTTTSTR